MKRIEWLGYKFYYSHRCFKPLDSSFPLVHAVHYACEGTKKKIPLIDMCCGIGAIGIVAFLQDTWRFSDYLGLDNDPSSVALCDMNIELHGLPGKAIEWEAGNVIPISYHRAIVVCNPPFLPLRHTLGLSKDLIKFVSTSESGLEVIGNCFTSLEGSCYTLILKSLTWQYEYFKEKIIGPTKIIAFKTDEISEDYSVTTSIWKCYE